MFSQTYFTRKALLFYFRFGEGIGMMDVIIKQAMINLLR
jgi:hypothetical protein